MDSRNLLLGVVSLSIVVVLGYVLGRWTAPEDEAEEPGSSASVEPAARKGRVPATPRGGSPGVVLTEQQQRVAELEADLALHKLRKETLEYELYGEPISWPDDVPQKFQPEWFRDNFRRAVQECAPDVEIVGFDCSEPPCQVQLRGGEEGWWNRLINECPGWADHYGNRVTSSTGRLECPGGGEERFRIISPVASELDGDDPEAKENRRKRWHQRAEEARYNWECVGSDGAP